MLVSLHQLYIRGDGGMRSPTWLIPRRSIRMILAVTAENDILPAESTHAMGYIGVTHSTVRTVHLGEGLPRAGPTLHNGSRSKVGHSCTLTKHLFSDAHLQVLIRGMFFIFPLFRRFHPEIDHRFLPSFNDAKEHAKHANNN